MKDRFNYSSYNLGLPHYTFAEALAIDDENFCARILPWGAYSTGYLTEFQTAHNQMHDYLSFCMWDGSFSIMTPLFFVYHAFIDYLLELRIRMAGSRAYESVQNFCDTNFTWRINRDRIARNDEVRTILNIFGQDGIMNDFG